MLVLSRKIGESIVIGDDIEISVVDIQAEQVKIAINAPKQISIHRKEIYIQIKEENKASSQASEDSLNRLKNIMK